MGAEMSGKSFGRRRPEEARIGCGGILWVFLKIPFMLIRATPHLGDLLRHEAATDTGAEAAALFESLPPADDEPSVAAALSALAAHDPAFDLAATSAGVIRARGVVTTARLTLDPSAARPVMSDGLWRVLAMLLLERSSHGIRLHEDATVTGTSVVSATRDRLAEELRIRLVCEGDRCEVEATTGAVIRGDRHRRTWREDWTVRRSANATTIATGGVLDNRCPQCGAPLDVDALGACVHCRALVLTGGRDWVVWNIEEERW
jgi:hypothetical protein